MWIVVVKMGERNDRTDRKRESILILFKECNQYHFSKHAPKNDNSDKVHMRHSIDPMTMTIMQYHCTLYTSKDRNVPGAGAADPPIQPAAPVGEALVVDGARAKITARTA